MKDTRNLEAEVFKFVQKSTILSVEVRAEAHQMLRQEATSLGLDKEQIEKLAAQLAWSIENEADRRFIERRSALLPKRP